MLNKENDSQECKVNNGYFVGKEGFGKSFRQKIIEMKGIRMVEVELIEIHSVNDVTDEFLEKGGYTLGSILAVDMTYKKNGKISRDTFRFLESIWYSVKKNGFFWDRE